MKGRVVKWLLVVVAIIGSMLSIGYLVDMLSNLSFAIE
jgi:hypothetical protein